MLLWAIATVRHLVAGRTPAEPLPHVDDAGDQLIPLDVVALVLIARLCVVAGVLVRRPAPVAFTACITLTIGSG